MKNRFLKTLGLALIFSAIASQAQERITVKGTQFFKGDKPYSYIGTNYWYGSLLASKKVGDRKRLLRELDLMQKNGIDNLRILVGGDGGKYDFTVRPALQYEQGKYDKDLLDGLDFLIYEMSKRKMYAVLYLTNNWEWSGGMSQYLEWNGKGAIPVPNIAPNTWPQFMAYTEQFHSCEPCMKGLENHVKFIMGRTNAYSHKKYTDDNTIMSWQVGNEPRTFTPENEAKFTLWLNNIVNLMDSLDKKHLISTGSEGKNSSNDSMEIFERTHQNPNIDYLTMHIWPKNWNWFKANDAEKTLPTTLENAGKYIDDHIKVANNLKRPIIIEEFGLGRENESLLATSSVTNRDIFYDYIFSRVAESHKNNGPLQAANFWGFGGEGKAVNENGKWNPGDPLTTDPPQEPQGLNSVFSSDKSTLDIAKKYNLQLKK
ncbi:glycoside hydrolase 5 family protein [Flavobacterium hibernum]|uniref:mannan endo-1,4-beta-mannosidase n=1 Tax=Flavobacterium hibernum TaxID=37752 RepID=A0A0D0EWH0_9FLAO|nr:cellulase family glycosylhydrolase [Flavobacterium hibernum]KIO53288.1 beta-mannanase [Flavobacterium hibernum]OXA87888.1 beta-mannanase [Flavobacterium hibernum]STO10476.1 Endo-beta-mannanase [Flavobacterium hibernum]